MVSLLFEKVGPQRQQQQAGVAEAESAGELAATNGKTKGNGKAKKKKQPASKTLGQEEAAPPATNGALSPAEMQCRRTILAMMLHKICDHVRNDSAQEVWAILHKQLQHSTKQWDTGACGCARPAAFRPAHTTAGRAQRLFVRS
eukprot:SAG22_NODE_611_length_8586_cov_8.288795_6_plen_144_part_00